MHLRDEIAHGGQGFFWLEDHKVRTFGDDVQLIVCDKGGNFHNYIGLRIEACHFEVHPNQHFSNLIGIA